MSVSRPVFVETFKYIAINKYICDQVATEVLSEIIFKCTSFKNKDPQAKCLEFMLNLVTGTKFAKYYSNRFHREPMKSKLEQCDTIGYDVQLLVEMLEVCYPGLASRDHDDWKTEDDDKLEWVLNVIRSTRNDIMHEPVTAACKKETAVKLEKYLHLAISLTNKDIQEASRWKDEITKKIADVSAAFGHDRQDYLSQTRMLLNHISKCDLRKYFESKLTHTGISFSTKEVKLSDVYRESVLITRCDVTGVTGEFPVRNIMERCGPLSESGIYVIEGVPGSGKTVLLKTLATRYFNDEDPFKKFDVLFYVRARYSTDAKFSDIVKRTFKSFIDHQYILYVEEEITNLKTLLLFDGLDELNIGSECLLKEMLDLYKDKNMTVIATSRQYAGSQFKRYLIREGIQTTTFRIRELNDHDKKDLLQKYLRNFNSSVTETEVNEIFYSLSASTRELLIHPAQIGMYCRVFAGRNTVGNSALRITELDLLQTLVKWAKENMMKPLAEERLTDDAFANDIFNIFAETSLQLLANDYLFIDTIHYKEMREKIFKKLNRTINVDNVAECVFCIENSAALEYTFSHKTQQEYMAAIAILNRLEMADDVGKYVSHIIEDMTGSEYTGLQLQTKFGVVFKYLIQELHSKGLLWRHEASVLQLLNYTKAPYTFIADVISTADYNRDILACLCSAVYEDSDAWWRVSSTGEKEIKHWTGWSIENGSQAKVCALMLDHMKDKQRYHQPSSLWLDLESASCCREVRQVHSAIRQYFKGKLRLFFRWSVCKDANIDPLIMELDGARCQLDHFEGNVCSATALEVLANMSDGTGDVNITTSSPEVLKHMNVMHRKVAELHVYLKCTDTVMVEQAPLPRLAKCNPELSLWNVQPGSLEIATQLIVKVAPKNKRYRVLNVLECGMSSSDVDVLLKNLKDAKVQTDSEGETRFFKYKQYDNGFCECCHTVHNMDTPCFSLHVIEPSTPAASAWLIPTLATAGATMLHYSDVEHIKVMWSTLR